MEAKYFNTWEFDQAANLVKTNPYEAKRKFEEYLEKYPNDYLATSYYAYTLIKLGDFESGEKILNYVEETSSNDRRFSNGSNKPDSLYRDILFNKLRLLSYQGRYEEFFNLRFNNPQGVVFSNFNSVDFYCKMKMGTLSFDDRDKNSYLFRQIISYDESDFLQHLNKHCIDYTEDWDNIAEGIFSANFPVNKVIEEIKKYIPSDKCLFPGFYEDVYIFKYDGCGRNNNKSVDYFKVICFHDTCNFITMYPLNYGKDCPYVDLNYLVNDNKNTKVKKLSQIDKFNKKYGLN